MSNNQWSGALAKASPDTIRLNPGLFSSGADPGPGTKPPPDSKPKPAPAKKMIRQDSQPKVNKTEAAFADYLRVRLQSKRVKVTAFMEQAIRLRLANGLWYKPDIIVQTGEEWNVYEVKGYRWRHGIQALKVAAGLYPQWCFWLVTKDGRGWNMERVLP